MKIVDGTNVRVIELGAELGFAFEAFEVGGPLRQLRREHLNDDCPVEFGVEGLIDCSLAARTDLFEDLILVNLGTNHKNAGYVRLPFAPYSAKTKNNTL
jgi:hypothetical protein